MACFGLHGEICLSVTFLDSCELCSRGTGSTSEPDPRKQVQEHSVTSAGRCLLVSGTAGPWSLPFLFEESAALGGGGEGAGIVLRCWHRLRFWLRGAFCVILKKLERERQAWMIQGLNSVSCWCRPSLEVDVYKLVS